jgi:hypothetical protein
MQGTFFAKGMRDMFVKIKGIKKNLTRLFISRYCSLKYILRRYIHLTLSHILACCITPLVPYCLT